MGKITIFYTIVQEHKRDDNSQKDFPVLSG